MKPKLERQMLIDRLHNAVSQNYLSLASIIGGVNLAIGADSLMRFINAPAFPWDQFPLWVSSFESLIIAYSALTLVPIVVAFSPNWRDHIFPLVIGLSVLMLFELLPNPALIAPWYFFAAVTSVSRVGLSHYVATHLRRLEYEDEIQEAIESFGHWMRQVSRAHIGTTSFFLLAGIVLLLFPNLPMLQWLFGIASVIINLWVILRIETARSRLIKVLS